MPPAEPGFDPDLLPSVLDRLIGVPVAGEPAPRRLKRSRVGRLGRIEAMLRREGMSLPSRISPVDWIVAALKEDLRCLLNARRAIDPRDDRDPLARSVLGFGLADLSDRALAGPRGVELLKETILEAVRRFEPRLSNVKVEDDENGDKSARPQGYEIRIRITCDLEVGSGSRPFAFDTVMRMTTNQIDVEERSDGSEAH